MPLNDAPIVFKVVLVGDASVGKTSLLFNWSSPGEFSEYYEPTVSPEITTKDLVVAGRTVRLQVWDMGFGDADTVAAQFPGYVHGAAGALLTYDLSDPTSVEGIAHWHEQVKSLAGPQCISVVVGCKADLQVAPGVVQKARDFCSSIRAEALQVSAARSNAAEPAFQALAKRLLRQVVSPCDTPALPAPVAVAEPLEHGGLNEGTSSQHISDGSGTARIIKLVVVGDAGVGKSCLALRLAGEQELPFQEEYVPTAGPEFSTITRAGLSIPSVAQALTLQIWDAAGEDLMNNSKVSVPVLQDANAVVIVYDVTARPSFEHVSQWLQLVKARAAPEASVILVGNKMDKAKGRVVSAEQGRSRGKTLNLPFLEFSAKCMPDVSEMLRTLLGSGQVEAKKPNLAISSTVAVPPAVATVRNTGSARLPQFGLNNPAEGVEKCSNGSAPHRQLPGKSSEVERPTQLQLLQARVRASAAAGSETAAVPRPRPMLPQSDGPPSAAAPKPMPSPPPSVDRLSLRPAAPKPTPSPPQSSGKMLEALKPMASPPQSADSLSLRLAAPKPMASPPQSADSLSLRQKLYDSLKRVKDHIEERKPGAAPGTRPQEPRQPEPLPRPGQLRVGMVKSADSLSKFKEQPLAGWEPDEEPRLTQSPSRTTPEQPGSASSLSAGARPGSASSLSAGARPGSASSLSVGARPGSASSLSTGSATQFNTLAAQFAQRLAEQTSTERQAKPRPAFQIPRDATGGVDLDKLKEALSRKSNRPSGFQMPTSPRPATGPLQQTTVGPSRALRNFSVTGNERESPQSPSSSSSTLGPATQQTSGSQDGGGSFSVPVSGQQSKLQYPYGCPPKTQRSLGDSEQEHLEHGRQN
eukprot:gnl/TRDRNA2_/TRDRNA2_157195_c0_seq1.p1 gnl/TRDRNA2_/TRDRNA2_157195_c0~~gnl/TRDRNA2_/TRDRNA2_157195_c0_seq1.p1  ORF type:complete len:865 (+),score=140.92 gnl/TRDRNA2_/TRDRNA2_157195_c0_seq1:74-2668(+)